MIILDTPGSGGGGSGVDLPVSVANGGTGSTTAPAARVALGVSEIIAAVAQVVVVSVQNSATNSWAGEYVDIDDGTEVCRFWFTVDGGGSAPSAPSPGRLQVVAVSDGSSPTDVEAAFIIALSSQSAAFSAIPSYSGSFTVTNLTAGAAPGNGSSLPTDFSFSISTAGADAISRLAEADGSQLTNINAATIPGPLTTNLGGVYSSSGSPGQFVTGVATSGDLIYSALPTTAIANGGTGQTAKTAAFDALAPTTTKGDLIVHNGADNIRVAVGGTNGHVLTVDSAEASGVKWAAGGSSAVYNATSSDSTSSSTTLADLLTATVGATGTYGFFATGLYGGSVSGEGMSMAINGPTASSINGQISIATNAAGSLTNGAVTAYDTKVTATISPTLPLISRWTISGRFVATATGTFAIRFAAETGGANSVTVSAGATLQLFRI